MTVVRKQAPSPEATIAPGPESASESSVRDRRGCPFRGLAYFEQGDAQAFAGRSKDIRELSSEILKNRKLIVYGRSGLGKTSLLLAGIFPRLHELGCKTVYVRALLDPTRDLFDAAHAQLGGNGLDDLSTLIERCDDAGPVVIVFDQFEEFFIRFCRRPGSEHADRDQPSERQRDLREAFIGRMAGLAGTNALDVRLVFSLREDWFAEMESFEDPLPGIMRNGYRLLPLTAFGVRESITRMLKVFGVPFDARLVSGLVEVLAAVNFDPAVLQVMCAELWSEAEARCGGSVDRLELADLQRVGSVSDLFARYLNQVTANIPEGSKVFALHVRAVLASMITPQRTKLAAPRGHFLGLHFKITDEELGRVLALLAEQNLVRTDQRQDAVWFELIHERLIENILVWLDCDTEFFRFRDALNTVRTLSASPGWREDPRRLLNLGQLEGVVGPYKELLHFAQHERLFLLESAICTGSEQLGYWAEQSAPEVLMASVEGLLRSSWPPARAMACRAVEVLPVQAPQRRTVRDLALADPELQVRQAASRAFARGISPEELKEVDGLLRWRSGPALLDLAAQVLRYSHDPSSVRFGWYRAFRARRRLERMKLEERAVAVAAAQSRVTSAAFAAAGVWSLVVVPVMMFIGICVGAPAKIFNGTWLEPVSVVSFVIFLTAALAGLRIGRRAIFFAVQCEEEAQLERAFMRRWVSTSVGALALIGVATGYAVGESAGATLSFVSCLLWSVPLFMAWSSMLGRLARPSLWSARTKGRRWLWTLVWSLGGTLAPAAVLWLLSGTDTGQTALELVDDANAPIPLRILCVCAAMSFALTPLVATATFCGLATICSISPLPGQDGPHRVARDPVIPLARARRASGVGLSLLGSAVLMFFWANGLDVLPFQPRVLHIGLGRSITAEVNVPPARVPYDTAFIRLDIESSGPRMVHVVSHSLSPSVGDISQFDLYRPGSTLLRPIELTRNRGVAFGADVRVSLLPQVENDVLASPGWQFDVIRFERIADAKSNAERQWASKLSLSVAIPAQTLDLCTTGVATWAGSSLDVVYGAGPGKAIHLRDSLSDLFVSKAEQLTQLTREPTPELEAKDFWSGELSCETLPIVDGKVNHVLPILGDASGASAQQITLQSGDSIDHLFLVRAR